MKIFTTARHTKARSRRSTTFTLHARKPQELTAKGDTHIFMKSSSTCHVHDNITSQRCHNGFSQCTGASAANGVVHKGKCGDGPIHLVILHKNSAAITAPMQFKVPPDPLPSGLGTLRSKRTEDSRVKGCPALSCRVSSSAVLSQLVLLLSQQAVPRYPECCLFCN